MKRIQNWKSFFPNNKGCLFSCLTLLCTMLNIIYMHLEIFDLSLFEYRYNIKSHFFVIFDVLILYSLFLSLFKRRIGVILIPYIISTIYIFINVAYSRYFETYLPFSLYLEYNNLNGLSSNIYDAFEWTDIFLLITTAIVFMSYKAFAKVCQNIKFISYTFYIWLFILFVMSIPVFKIYYKENARLKEHFTELKDNRTLLTTFCDDVKNARVHSDKIAFFNFGLFYNVMMELIENTSSKNYDTQIQENISYFSSSSYIPTDSFENRRIILIIMESLSSYPIDMVVDGKELTPNINSLKKEGYYNPNMYSETKLGESSDGQYIYMTGLLPLKNKVTINEIADSGQIPSFPLLLKREDPRWFVYMVIPTDENSWSQKSMCQKYGIDKLYTRNDYEGKKGDWLTDEQLFELSANIDSEMVKEKQYSMSILLTSSTHSPYNNRIENNDFIFPDSLSFELKNYLSNVHYADKCLGKYVQDLKDMGIFDKSMIVIVSDHKPNTPKLNVKDPALCAQLPLIIVNPPVKLENEECPIYQTTLFPTMLDLCRIENKWRGVGQSLLMPDSIQNTKYEIERKRREQEISDVLLYSNYKTIE